MKQPKIAIVHDVLTEYGGSERVLESLIALYPSHDYYTFFFNTADAQLQQKFQSLAWQTSFLQRGQFLAKLRQYFSIFKPLAWWYFARLNLSSYDLVISSTHSFNAKAVRTRPTAQHVSYIHTPPRFLYGLAHELNHLTQNLFVQLLLRPLRWLDQSFAQRPTTLVVNSAEVQRRVLMYYQRQSTIIYPPVTVPEIKQSRKVKKYFVIHSRLVKQKNIEFLILAANQLKLPVKVIGDGYLRAHLQQIAGSTIEFLGFITDHDIHKVYQSAHALLYAAEGEDFGIVPVEAQALGVPVVAYRSGGVRETVRQGVTGYFFDTLTVTALSAALHMLQTKPIAQSACIRQARQFRPERFASQLRRVIKARTHNT